jgi:hypothetical protein
MLLKQELAKNLTFTVRTGMDYSVETRQMIRNFSSNRFQKGGYAEHDVKYREVNTDFLLNYNNTFGDFSFDASFGGNRMDRNASTKQSQAVNLAQPGIFNLNNAASPIEVYQFQSKIPFTELLSWAIKIICMLTLLPATTGRAH